MTSTTDVELDPALVEWVKQFLKEKPFYVKNPSPSAVVELVVTEMGAGSRAEVVHLEETVKRLLRYGEIMLGDREPDDYNADPRTWSGPWSYRVIWVE